MNINRAYTELVTYRKISLSVTGKEMADYYSSRIRTKFQQQVKRFPDTAKLFDMLNKTITSSYDDHIKTVHIKLVPRKEPINFEIVT